VLTGAPRAATSPINACGTTFACLNRRRASHCSQQGLISRWRTNTAEQRNRDSLALDTIEPVRADVDTFLLDLLEDRGSRSRFGELLTVLPDRGTIDARGSH